MRRQRRRFIRELWAVAQSQVPSERRPSAVSATRHTSTPVLVRSRKLNRAFSADVDRSIGVLGRWPRLADEPRRWRGNSLGEGPKTIEYRSLNGLSGSPGLGNTPWKFEPSRFALRPFSFPPSSPNLERQTHKAKVRSPKYERGSGPIPGAQPPTISQSVPLRPQIPSQVTLCQIRLRTPSSRKNPCLLFEALFFPCRRRTDRHLLFDPVQ